MAETANGSSRMVLRGLEPLRERTFRTIWTASLLSNFGQLILGVGVAWEMTRLTPSQEMVALVQSALMLPLMLVSVPAGAIADMFDRRKVAMTGLGFASLCAAILTFLAISGLTTPWVLLAFCSLIGGGVAFYSPAWQASIPEQVTAEQLPAAVALGSVSYNVARSFGPALGGMIVMWAGATAAFGINSVFYLPLLIAFFFWKRRHVPPRLPPERIDRAIISGARYAIHSSPIRTVMIRAFVIGLGSAAQPALMPLVAKNLLGGDARTYGIMLGANGVGAVLGALMVSSTRERLKAEHGIILCTLVGAVAIGLLGLSHYLALTCLWVAIAGGAFMLLVSLLNVGVQMSAPRWVIGRALSWFQSSLTAGICFGAWMWGHATAEWGVGMALMVAGGAIALTPLLGLLLPMPRVSLDEVEMVELGDAPDVALAITARSGPIIIEVDYRVDPEQAREFYGEMLKMQHARLRNGGFDWSLARDLADPALWTERYHTPTWADYLRLRSRFTHSDREQQAAVDKFHHSEGEGQGHRVRRRLERPFGSVRWQADTPDPSENPIRTYTP